MKDWNSGCDSEKNGKLTTEEYEIIKTHTTKGAEMLKDFSSIPDIKDGAL